MIRLVHTPLRPRQYNIPPDAYEIEYCSEECVWRQLPGDVQIVRHGSSTTGIAAHDAHRLWLNISDETHPVDHPLYMNHTAISNIERAGLLRRVQAINSPGLVPIHAVCNCGFCIELLHGLPLEDRGSRPPWHVRLHQAIPQEPLTIRTWDDFAVRLPQLLIGLRDLHANNLVHGDPFGLNVVVCERGCTVWIDLNDILPLTPDLVAVDLVGFLQYVFLPTLMRLQTWNPGVVAALLQSFGEQPVEQILDTMLQIFADAHPTESVATGANLLDSMSDLIESSGLLLRTDRFGQIVRRLITKGFLFHYQAFEWNAGVALERERYLAAEQVRHQLVERELERVVFAHYQTQLQSQELWIQELQQGKTWLNQQYINWKTEAERRGNIIEDQRNWINHLESSQLQIMEQYQYWQTEAQKAQDIIQQYHPLLNNKNKE